MEFSLTDDDRALQGLCRELAQDFARRAANHDRDASSPRENYAALRAADLFGLTVPRAYGGRGAGMLGYTLAMEELAQGCAATAMSFNMHCVAAYTITATAAYDEACRVRYAKLVVDQGKLFANLISEAGTTNLLYSTRASSTQARRTAGGYTVHGRKAFATMMAAADYALVCVHPEHIANPEAVIMVVTPTTAAGVSIDAVWDTLGMRATASDNVVFDGCFVPDEWAFDDPVIPSIGEFLSTHESLINLPYTAVYMGVGLATLAAAKAAVAARTPKGYRQSLAYHPDVRRRIGRMSAELEAARWLLRYAAWVADVEGQSANAQTAMFRAKYMVGEAVARATRSALELGGAHALFKGGAIERLFRDGATASIMQPSSDVCLGQISLAELELDRSAVVPPLERERKPE
jgi:alkylation response protein AidB-like acyl-CoA dehydrogenase